MLHVKLRGKTKGHVAFQIKGKKCRTLCKFDLIHTPDLLGNWVGDKYNLMELGELIVFGYNLSDTLWLRSGRYSR